MHKVEQDIFNHFDFVVAKDADKLVYDIVLDEINKLEKKP